MHKTWPLWLIGGGFVLLVGWLCGRKKREISATVTIPQDEVKVRYLQK